MKPALLTLALIACSGPPSPSSGLNPPSLPDAGCPSQDQNPYGACYPTTGLGSTIDTVVANYCFDGMPPFCLAAFYDPAQKLGIKLVEIVVASAWDPASHGEMDFIAGTNATGANPQGVSWANDLGPLGVVFVVLLDDGSFAGVYATLGDLATWSAEHGSTITTGIDPGNANLGVFFDSGAVPLNMDVDARTMRLLGTSVGFDASGGEDRIRAIVAAMK